MYNIVKYCRRGILLNLKRGKTMKKLISVVMLMAVLMGVFAVCAFADAKADIVAKAEEVCPDGYESEYIPALKNILAQIDVTDEQAAAAIASLESSKAIVNSGKGTKLADYTQAEKDHVLADLKTACAALKIGYTIVEKEDITTVTFYKLNADNTNGDKLGEVSIGGEIKTTNVIGEVTAPVAMLLVAAAALVVLASAAYVCQKSRA